MVDYMILTEKRSAFDNFKVALGGETGTVNGHSYQLVHAQGHLLQYAAPEEQVSSDLHDRYKSWDLQYLPWRITDFNWKLVPIPQSIKVLQRIKKVSRDAQNVVIATDNDASGEGELLAWEILNAIGWRGPVYREYHDDESPAAITAAMRDLKDISVQDEDGDYLKARTRSQWDFASMQLTRLATGLVRQAGYDVKVLPQGRLKSVIIGMIYQREQAIKHYVRKPYYEVKFRDEYDHLYAREVKKDDEEALQKVRHLHKNNATLEAQQYQASEVEEISRATKHQAPNTLLDLSKLDAILAKQGYSSSLIKKTYQTLYEQNYVSYPRTDDKVITTAQFDELVANRKALAGLAGIDESLLTHLDARPKLVKDSATHGANRPGSRVPASLEEIGQAVSASQADCAKDIYRLLAKSALAILGADYEYLEIKGRVSNYPEFVTKVNQPINLGYKLIYHTGELPKQTDGLGQQAKPVVTEGANPKPAQPTKLWLFKKLASVGKYGIGTGATQQSTMADLTNKQGHYLINDKRGKLSLTATGNFVALISLHSYIASPKITMQLFDGMDQIRAGKMSPEKVLNTINKVMDNALTQFPANLQKLKQEIPLTDKNKIKQATSRQPREKVSVIFYGKQQQFNRKWGQHYFTDTEVESLKAGETISFKYKGRTISGTIAMLNYKGRKFLGFKPDFEN